MFKIYHLDDNNNIVDQKDATHTNILEFDENGSLIREIFEKNNNASSRKNEEDFIPSEKNKQIVDELFKNFKKR